MKRLTLAPIATLLAGMTLSCSGEESNGPGEMPLGAWTWVSGSSSIDQSGVYGTKGTASPSNVPGARTGSVSWIDAAGDFWLFGGFGFDRAGRLNELNDLWRFRP